MRKILLGAAAVALFTAAFAGVAVAKSFVCTTIPCEGTSKPDQIGERNGSVADIIRAGGGEDLVGANRAGNDKDDVLGQSGDDVLNLADGDFRDNGNCGSGEDTVVIDFEFVFEEGPSGNVDGIRGCETVLTDFQPPALVASMSKEEITANSTVASPEIVAAAEAKGKK